MDGAMIPPKGLSPDDKNRWNKFVEYVAKQGQANNPQLDQRNKQLGMSLLQRFNYANPQDALPMDIVKNVQQEIHNYRTDLVNKWKKDPTVINEPIKDESEIMSKISPVDGWPGTLTLSHKFPVGTLTEVKDGKKTVQNFGTDLSKYDAVVASKKPQSK